MSLFTKIVSVLDEVDALLAPTTTPHTPVTDYPEWVSADARLADAEKTLARFATKAAAGRADPAKKIYGDAMCARIDAASARIGPLRESLDARMAVEADAHSAREREMQAERDAAEAVRTQEAARQAEEAAAEQAAREKEETRRKEEEDRARVEKRRRIEAEAERARKQAADARAAEREKIAREADAAAAKRAATAAASSASPATTVGTNRGTTSAVATDPALPATFSISVRSTGKMRTMEVSGLTQNTTVAYVKDQIFASASILPQYQKLIFAGRVIQDSETLGTCKILPGVSIHLVERDSSTVPGGNASGASAATPATVQHITGGVAELSAITSARATQITLVDYSASWCGPCKALAPHFNRLAKDNPELKFVGVDVEATPENTALAAAVGISSYPTLVFMRGDEKVDEVRGANLTVLSGRIAHWKAAVASSSTPVPSASTSVVSPISMPAGSNVTERVLTAVRRIRSGSTKQEFTLAVQTLLTYVRNVVLNPGQEKFRKVRWGNSTFQQRVASRPGGPECMRAFGFDEERRHDNPGTIDFLVISEEAANSPELATVMRQLEEVIPGTIPTPRPTPATGHPATGQQQGPAGGAPLPGGFPGGTPLPGGFPGGIPGGFPGMGGNNAMMETLMGDPAFTTMAQELMADPTAMNDLMELQRAVESGDQAAIMRMSNNPSLLRMRERMMANPGVMNTMTNMMGAGTGGMPNPGAFPMPGMAGMPGPPPNQAPTQVGGFPAGAAPPGTAPAGATPTTGAAGVVQPPQPTFEGEPASAEEEERLLAEAIRLSMNESNNDFNSDQAGNGDGDGGGGGGT